MTTHLTLQASLSRCSANPSPLHAYTNRDHGLLFNGRGKSTGSEAHYTTVEVLDEQPINRLGSRPAGRGQRGHFTASFGLSALQLAYVCCLPGQFPTGIYGGYPRWMLFASPICG